MYSSYQEINRKNALNILTSIGQLDVKSDILENLIAHCTTDEFDIITDISQIYKDDIVEKTTKESLIQARVGQGKFRQNLMNIWNNSCAVTGCGIPELLRASHIKPWRDATNRQRLDPNNGLLLEANLDALFDSGLISFKDDGDMLVSNQLPQIEQQRLNIPSRLINNPNVNQQKYLDYHRNNVFKKS
jgi:predicted restriction endonuclease